MINSIIKNFKTYIPIINGFDNMKKAAVAILLCDIDGEINILFEIRSKNLRSQPGDICFPGGKIEENENEKNAVIREIIEELGLEKEDFKIEYKLSPLITYYGLLIYPFIGYINNVKKVNINKSEVDKIVLIPLNYLLNYSPMEVKNKIIVDRAEDFPYDIINGGINYKFREGIHRSLFYKYNKDVIWGITALILEDFLKFIKNGQ